MVQSESMEKGINNFEATSTRLNNNKWFTVLLRKFQTSPFDKFQIFITLAIIFTTAFSINYKLIEGDQETLQTEKFIAEPEIKDLYFLDFRVMSDNLRPRQKYRLAKVIDITGGIVSLVYSDMYYFTQRNIEEGIRFGHLRFNDYFQGKRYDFTMEQIK